MHESIPDVPSEPPNDTVTAWLYQPSPSAARSADALGSQLQRCFYKYHRVTLLNRTRLE